MHSFLQPARAGFISAMAVALAAAAPFAVLAQTKPTVTVVNPVSNPVNTRITNTVVPVEVSNADAITFQDADAGALTHVGQKPSRLVDLSVTRNGTSRHNQQSSGAPSFVVPEGYSVVVTDIELSANCTNDVFYTIDLWRQFPNGSRSVVIREEGVQCKFSKLLFERHYTTGMVFGAGQFFGVDAYTLFGNEPTSFVRGDLLGYLVPED